MSKTCGTVLLKTTDPKALEELSKKWTEKKSYFLTSH